MVSYSVAEAFAIRQEIRDELTEPALFCDVGGGHGYLLAELLKDRPKGSGIVFDLPQVTAEQDQHVTREGSLRGRCVHLAGDMFVSAPEADVYLLKHILHDWNDEECQRILSVIRKAAKPTSTLMICEWIVPGSEEPHFAKIVDIAMLCISSGRQRTVDEFTKLLSATGWAIESMRQLKGSSLAILKAAAGAKRKTSHRRSGCAFAQFDAVGAEDKISRALRQPTERFTSGNEYSLYGVETCARIAAVFTLAENVMKTTQA